MPSDSPVQTTDKDLPRRDAPPATVLFHRGSIVESVHRAHACIVGSDGELVHSLGAPDFVTYMRSAAKPLQALAVVVSGAVDAYGLTPPELAIIAGSHGGEPFHVATVKSILAKTGLSEADLRCGVHPPLDAAAARVLRETGANPTPLHHNCSGKHAGMLATAVLQGQPTSSYTDPDHPVQRGITELVALTAGVAPDDVVIGVDGCSAPVHAIPLRAAALAYARLVEPSGLPGEVAAAAQRVTAAMRSHPEMVAATRGRICTELIRTGESVGLIAKAGAEGFYAAAWFDPERDRGVGLAVKVEDGAQRGRNPLVLALLQHMMVLPGELPEPLQRFAAGPIRNYAGAVVGNVEVKLG